MEAGRTKSHSLCTAEWDTTYRTIHFFCEGLSLSQRTHSFRRHDIDMLVFCLAKCAYAERRDRGGQQRAFIATTSP